MTNIKFAILTSLVVIYLALTYKVMVTQSDRINLTSIRVKELQNYIQDDKQACIDFSKFYTIDTGNTR